MSPLAALRLVLDPGRIIRPPIVFSEESATSSCEDTELSDCDDGFGVRLRTNDHLKVLRGSPGRADGFCNLPDYIVFHEEQDSRGGERWLVKAMLAELKSSDASQELAVRQLQLGALLVQYLLSIARFGGQLYSIVELRQCALLISPNLPEPKGRTKRQKTEYEAETLAGVKIPRYDVPCGAKISFDEFEYWSAEI